LRIAVLAKVICILLLASAPLTSRAESFSEPFSEQCNCVLEKKDISGLDRAANFGIVYVAQWFSYIVTQPNAIAEYGSLHNWTHNPFRPHFDHDGIGFNLLNHTISGQLYYQFYRFRGYTELESFFWSFLSSAAFEFTIETLTERPSFQDLYQTPILGTAVGMGLERLSCYFHAQDNWPAHLLGYILNPFTILSIGEPRYRFQATPILRKDGLGASASWSF
jgi:hypothetical protein